jgi:hypothetical protein
MLRGSTRFGWADCLAAIATLGAIGSARVARAQVQAQERGRNAPLFHRSVAAPSRALELGIAGGYDQGVGALGGAFHPNVQDVAGVGAGADVTVGYRFSPHASLGVFGSGALYTAIQPSSDTKSVAAGLRGTWHFRPFRSADPWLSVGAGYRVFWNALPGQPGTVHNAIQAIQLGLGVDYRLSAEFGIGPYISSDLSIFFREARPGLPSTSVSAAISSFVSAGISARFDLLGEALHPAVDIASR